MTGRGGDDNDDEGAVDDAGGATDSPQPLTRTRKMARGITAADRPGDDAGVDGGQGRAAFYTFRKPTRILNSPCVPGAEM